MNLKLNNYSSDFSICNRGEIHINAEEKFYITLLDIDLVAMFCSLAKGSSFRVRLDDNDNRLLCKQLTGSYPLDFQVSTFDFSYLIKDKLQFSIGDTHYFIEFISQRISYSYRATVLGIYNVLCAVEGALYR